MWATGDSAEHIAVVAMTLRVASIEALGKFTDRQQLEALVCDCCQTSAVMVLDNPFVSCCDRTENGQRNIASRHWLQGAGSAPQPVAVDGWQINGFFVKDSVLTARKNDVVTLFFSGAGGQWQKVLSHSANCGAYLVVN